MTLPSLPSRGPVRWLPVLVWYGVIFLFSAQTGDASSQLSSGVIETAFRVDLATADWDLVLMLSFLVRKGAHMFVYFVLTGLLLFALGKRKGAVPLAVGLCALLAGLDEFHQYFVPGRSCKLTDVFIDLAGGLVFLLFLRLWRAVWAHRKAKAAV